MGLTPETIFSIIAIAGGTMICLGRWCCQRWRARSRTHRSFSDVGAVEEKSVSRSEASSQTEMVDISTPPPRRSSLPLQQQMVNDLVERYLLIRNRGARTTLDLWTEEMVYARYRQFITPSDVNDLREDLSFLIQNRV